MDAGNLDALAWRLIGPFRGGRVVAVAGDPARLDGHHTELQRAVETEGAAFDDLIRAVALPPIG